MKQTFMDTHPSRASNYLSLGGLLLAGLLFALLAACGATGEQTSLPAVTPIITLTTGMSTQTPNYKEVALTEFAENYSAMRTSVALTAAPTWTWGPPPIYPTPTLAVGIQDCTNARPYGNQCINAWREFVNGQRVDVQAGHEGRDGNPAQGLIMVSVAKQHFQVYETPLQVGAVRIVSANGQILTLVTVDHQPQITFAFDLTTRQWVTPPPSPVPSEAPSPAPSSSPLLSPLPSPSPAPSP